MSSIIYKIYKYLYESKPIRLIISISVLSYVCSSIVFILIPEDLIFNSHTKQDLGLGIVWNIVIIGIIIPILETFSIFTLIHSIIKKSKKYYKYFVLIASTVFGLGHYYSFQYIVWAFIMGFFMAIQYRLAYRKREKPIVQVIIVHSIHNIIAVVLRELMKIS
jgi:uncharacterized protein